MPKLPISSPNPLNFSLLLLTLTYVCWFPSTAVRAQPTAIFILAGQSNMAGQGGVYNNIWDRVVPAECNSNPAVLQLTAGLRWVEAAEPLHQDIDVNKTCGVGPGMAFANRMLRLDPGVGVVGLVPCAVGGTSIVEWARGGFLYGLLVKRSWASVQGGGRIKGLLWYQGESDTRTRDDADKYGERLEQFFGDFRADLNTPLLPIVQVAIASGIGPYNDTVREAQLGVGMKQVTTVDAKGLPLEPDGLHLSTPGQVRLGEMMANAFLQLLPGRTHSNEACRLRFPIPCYVSLLLCILVLDLSINKRSN